jgi:crotonobetainyl-CoA:carnitine CoA-transferase CaiB-like acyl-CoA transferase
MNYLSSGVLPRRNGTASQVTCPWQTFDCADRPIMIAIGNDAQFRRFAAFIDLPELADDPRYETNLARVRHADTLIPVLAERLKTRNAEEWNEALNAVGIPAGPLNSFEDVFEDPQVRHRELLRTFEHPTAGTVRYVGNPVRLSSDDEEVARRPPLFAEHTDEVLKELGLDQMEIAELRQAGAAA